MQRGAHTAGRQTAAGIGLGDSAEPRSAAGGQHIAARLSVGRQAGIVARRPDWFDVGVHRHLPAGGEKAAGQQVNGRQSCH